MRLIFEKKSEAVEVAIGTVNSYFKGQHEYNTSMKEHSNRKTRTFF